MRHFFVTTATEHRLPYLRAKFPKIIFKTLTDTPFSSELQLQIHGKLEGECISVLHWPIHISYETIGKESKKIPYNFGLDYLFLTLHALKLKRPRKINLVIPYLPFCRQDKLLEEDMLPMVQVFATLLQTSGVTSLCTMDIHSEIAKGFFSVPLTSICSASLFSNHLVGKIKNPLIVAPDSGAAMRAKMLATLLNTDFIVMQKQRTPTYEIRLNAENGTQNSIVKGRSCVLFDDIMDSGRTIDFAVQELVNNGALDIHLCVTHLLNQTQDIWQENYLKRLSTITTTDSLCAFGQRQNDALTVLSILPLLEQFFDNDL